MCYDKEKEVMIMKKYTAMLLVFILLTFSFAGCADMDTKEGKSFSSATTTVAKPWEDPSLSEEDRAIRAVSDPVVMEHYGLKDLSSYDISIFKDLGDDISVRYEFLLYGYSTTEITIVDLSRADYSFLDASFATPEYSAYLDLVSEKDVRNAAAKMDEKIAPYGKNQIGYYYQLRGGVLSLCTELIISIEPSAEDIAQGMTSGCNIDHEHLTFQEIVYSPK